MANSKFYELSKDERQDAFGEGFNPYEIGGRSCDDLEQIPNSLKQHINNMFQKNMISKRQRDILYEHCEKSYKILEQESKHIMEIIDGAVIFIQRNNTLDTVFEAIGEIRAYGWKEVDNIKNPSRSYFTDGNRYMSFSLSNKIEYGFIENGNFLEPSKTLELKDKKEFQKLLTQ